jgi:hypothetical protein
MKTSDIEIALRANPKTLFWTTGKHGKSGIVQIVETHEKIIPKTYSGAPEKRTVTFTVDKIVSKSEKNYDPETGEVTSLEPVVTVVRGSGYKPQDISEIYYEQMSLEDACTKRQASATEYHFKALAERQEYDEMIAEINSKTQLGGYYLKKTPKEVLQVLREALKK